MQLAESSVLFVCLIRVTSCFHDSRCHGFFMVSNPLAFGLFYVARYSLSQVTSSYGLGV